MEKFGIFNILSALNSLTSQSGNQKKEEESKPPKKTEKGDVFNPPIYQMNSKPMLDILAKHDEISKRIDKNLKSSPEKKP